MPPDDTDRRRSTFRRTLGAAGALALSAVLLTGCGEQMFTLSATDASRQPLLVLAPNTGDAEEAADLLVTGTLQESFSGTDAEAFLGVDLDEAQFGRFDGQVYLEAESVETGG